jgi:hypothetical protein
MSRRRQRALWFVVLALGVAAVTFAALWRVAAPPVGSSTAAPPQPIGRPIVLEAAQIRDVPSPRTLWVDAAGTPRFAVLDPDVKRSTEIQIVTGARLTLIGLVRATPAADVAIRQWGIDEAEAARVLERGDYVYVTEIR